MISTSQQNRVFEAVADVVTRRTYDRALAATDLFIHHLAALGSVRRDGEQMLAGDLALNRDRTLLPRLAESTGLGFCVYLGNRRISTATVLGAGTAPAIGEFADAPLVDGCIRRKETFQGRIDYDGRPYVVVARPVFATEDSGTPIGIVEAFQDEQSFFDTISSTARATFQHASDDLSQRADGMESISKFIDDTARKLQLLSLNGNIIAAQAGEHGRAFRVVCRELGSLADQAKVAAGEVKRLVTAMGLDETDEVFELGDDVLDTTDLGAALDSLSPG